MSRDLRDFSVQLPINRDLITYQTQVKEKLYDFNHSRPAQHTERQAILNSLLGSANGVTIVPPFFCDLGHNIHFKCGGFLNTNVTILDIAPVTIGEYVQMGPNVCDWCRKCSNQRYTAGLCCSGEPVSSDSPNRAQ